jgi:hypothetical protein
MPKARANSIWGACVSLMQHETFECCRADFVEAKKMSERLIVLTKNGKPNPITDSSYDLPRNRKL